MTARQLEIARTFNDKEVMSNVIAKIRALTLNQLFKSNNDREKEEFRRTATIAGIRKRGSIR